MTKENPKSVYKDIFNQVQKEQTYQLLKHIALTVYNMFDYNKKTQVNGYIFKQVFFQYEKSVDYVNMYFLFEKDKKIDIFTPDREIMDETMFNTLQDLRNLFLGQDAKMITLTFVNHLLNNPKAKSLTDKVNQEEELKSFLGHDFFTRYEKEKLEHMIKNNMPLSSSLIKTNKAKI